MTKWAAPWPAHLGLPSSLGRRYPRLARPRRHDPFPRRICARARRRLESPPPPSPVASALPPSARKVSYPASPRRFSPVLNCLLPSPAAIAASRAVLLPPLPPNCILISSQYLKCPNYHFCSVNPLTKSINISEHRLVEAFWTFIGWLSSLVKVEKRNIKTNHHGMQKKAQCMSIICFLSTVQY